MEVWLEAGQSLGISIVGGRHVIKRLRNGEELRGIFIKEVLPHSPAHHTSLKTGDKIIEVPEPNLSLPLPYLNPYLTLPYLTLTLTLLITTFLTLTLTLP